MKQNIGEKNLEKLVKSMQPALLPDEYVFCHNLPKNILDSVDAVMIFNETEGQTAIIRLSDALKLNLQYEFRCKQITLNIHSNLNAVGFLATITTKLASLGISVNAVSAFYHDHLFVPSDRANEAIDTLTKLSAAPD